MGTCLECETNFDYDDNWEVGDVISCPECRTRLEIVGLEPVMVDYAVDEDEV